MSVHFYRVGKSEFLTPFKNQDATVRAIKKKKYVYIDFDDESKTNFKVEHVKVLESSQPNDSDE